MKGYDMKSQNESILKHLQKGKKLTPLDALKMFGSLRLGVRIYDLKQQGHNIVSKFVSRNGKTFSEYSYAD